MSDIRQSLSQKIQDDFTSSAETTPYPALITGYHKDTRKELSLAAIEASSAIPAATGFVEVTSTTWPEDIKDKVVFMSLSAGSLLDYLQVLASPMLPPQRTPSDPGSTGSGQSLGPGSRSFNGHAFRAEFCAIFGRRAEAGWKELVSHQNLRVFFKPQPPSTERCFAQSHGAVPL